jgi:hypothetical protein
MSRFARSMTGMAAAALVTLAATASAQDQAAAGGQAPRGAQARQGPLMVQPIGSGFVLTPEVRFTELNHSWGTQIGASGGWLYDETLYFGGAFYGLVGGANDQQLWYGGFVTGWNAPISGAVHVGVRGLFGWGHSETFEDWTYYPEPYHHQGQPPNQAAPVTQKAWVYQDFMVFEPSVIATIRLAKKASIEIGAGYRLTGNDYYGWDNHVNGAYGSIGVRLGVF